MEKRWVYKAAPAPEKVKSLAESLSIHEKLVTILCQRNICTFDEAKAYFRPSLDLLHDPFLMKDMHLAVNRLNEALHNGEKILIYGDYDVDGTTSVAMAYQYLQPYFRGKIDYYIPDRYKEGYGVSTAGINWASENG